MKAIFTTSAPSPVGPYSQGIKCGDFLFISGQLGLDPITGDFKGSDFASQAEVALKNIYAIIKEAGLDLKDIVRVEVFLCDINCFQEFNDLYSNFLNGICAPARQVVEVSALPKGALIEISCICSCKK